VHIESMSLDITNSSKYIDGAAGLAIGPVGSSVANSTSNIMQNWQKNPIAGQANTQQAEQNKSSVIFTGQSQNLKLAVSLQFKSTFSAIA